MENLEGYYTLKGYEINEKNELTFAMEDYLEMIFRIDGNVKVNEISKNLHVKPSSVSKMINHLTDLGYINSEKYGYIKLTEKGRRRGEYLLYRHNVVHNFLCVLNKSQNEIEQAEKIEHFFNEETIRNLKALTDYLKKTGDREE